MLIADHYLGLPFRSKTFSRTLEVLLERDVVIHFFDNEEFLTRWFSPLELRDLNGYTISKRKYDWAVGRIAAKIACRAFLGSSLKPTSILVKKSENGRPFFNETFLSISHCDSYGAACVSQLPVGIDVERIDQVSARSIELLVTDAEVQAVVDSLVVPFNVARALLWSLKEALFKAVGQGSFALFANNLLVTKWLDGRVEWVVKIGAANTQLYLCSDFWRVEYSIWNGCVKVWVSCHVADSFT